jgi:glycosyltransferase A (GT-A) superfamily protein (DUF2064 family)
MSTPTTGQAQRDRLIGADHTVACLPELFDVDHFDDARYVAGMAPAGSFARAFHEVMAC